MADPLDSPLARSAHHGVAASICVAVALACFPAFSSTSFAARAPAQTEAPPVSPDARRAIEVIYSGDFGAAIELAHKMEKAQPDDPLGYLIEDEARWWEIYCEALNIKYGMVDAWQRGKMPEDEEYLSLAEKIIQLSETKMKENDAAEMHLYAGLGWALKARLYGLRFEKHATAHAGVEARSQFLKALKLNPDLADADTGLGLYDYYIDSLSAFVKILRVFMGIPGGSKKDGIRLLQIGIDHGELTSADASFYLARNLRTFDHKYEEALPLVQLLVEKYPRNPIFLLLRGNLHDELGHNEQAAADFHAAEALDIPNAACAARVRKVAQSFLDSMQKPN
jgi:tetratricopeptide (TPR) repeat protein